MSSLCGCVVAAQDLGKTVQYPYSYTVEGNPLIRDIYSADVAALVHGGTVYIYTGHDEAPSGATSYKMNDWYGYSTKDFKTLTAYGPILASSSFAWAGGDAWASQVAERDGKFYWYVCASVKDTAKYGSGMAIGVAVADSPTGPFTDAIGAPLISTNMTKPSSSWTWDDIDPTVYIDDDAAKTAYLYFGNTDPKYIKLNADMISVDASGYASVAAAIHAVSLPSVASLGYTEAPWLCKHGGIYYLSYAAGWEEQLVYCWSNSPIGPWTAGGLLMARAKNCNTSHQAVIDFDGSSYILYHNGALSGGDSWHRSVCVDRFAYNADASMPTISPTFSR